MPRTARGFIPVKISVAVGPQQKETLDKMALATGQTLSAVGSVALAIGLYHLRTSMLGPTPEMQKLLAQVMGGQMLEELPNEEEMQALVDVANQPDAEPEQ